MPAIRSNDNKRDPSPAHFEAACTVLEEIPYTSDKNDRLNILITAMAYVLVTSFLSDAELRLKCDSVANLLFERVRTIDLDLKDTTH
jgi:hypothetical protein